jgi:hypothetical protein
MKNVPSCLGQMWRNGQKGLVALAVLDLDEPLEDI